MSTGTVAVVVLSHRYPAQVARLVRRLTDHPDTMVAVHHDPTGEPWNPPASPQIGVVSDPVHGRWGRLSLVEAVRRSLGWVRANVPDLSWALVISGQDYPIRSMRDIVAELAASPHDAYLRHFPVDLDPGDDVHPWQAVTRRRYYYKRRLPFSARSLPLPWPRRHPFHDGVRLYAGDMWINLSAHAVDKLLDSPLNDRVLRYLRFAPIPDEAYAVTVALNGDPALDVAVDSKRFIRWADGGGRHPVTLTPEHLPEIAASGAFFARKIDPVTHPEMCDLLDDLARRRAAAHG